MGLTQGKYVPETMVMPDECAKWIKMLDSSGVFLFVHTCWMLRTATWQFPFGLSLGFYMYIETSRPRLEGEKARLVSPVFSVAPKNPYGATNTAYCFSFYYHMYGQHIGERKPMTLSFHFGRNSRRNVLLHETKAWEHCQHPQGQLPPKLAREVPDSVLIAVKMCFPLISTLAGAPLMDGKCFVHAWGFERGNFRVWKQKRWRLQGLCLKITQSFEPLLARFRIKRRAADAPQVPAAGVAQPVCDTEAHGSFVKITNNWLASCGGIYFQGVPVCLFSVMALSAHMFDFFERYEKKVWENVKV